MKAFLSWHKFRSFSDLWNLHVPQLFGWVGIQRPLTSTFVLSRPLVWAQSNKGRLAAIRPPFRLATFGWSSCIIVQQGSSFSLSPTFPSPKTLLQRQRTGASPGEMQEAQGREAHHSAQSLQAEAQVPPKTSNTAGNKIKWPAAADKKAWNDFDSDICETPTIIDLRVIHLVSSPVWCEAETNKNFRCPKGTGAEYSRLARRSRFNSVMNSVFRFFLRPWICCTNFCGSVLS